MNLPLIKPPKQKQRDENEPRPWSSLIDKAERDKMWNTGYSLNSKKVTETLGFVDMKQICYCLAHAIMKHIEFGKGFFFLVDLQQSILKMQRAEAAGFSDGGQTPILGRHNDSLEFSYNLGEMKIELPLKEEQAKRLVLTSEQRSEDKNSFDTLQ